MVTNLTDLVARVSKLTSNFTDKEFDQLIEAALDKLIGDESDIAVESYIELESDIAVESEIAVEKEVGVENVSVTNKNERYLRYKKRINIVQKIRKVLSFRNQLTI